MVQLAMDWIHRRAYALIMTWETFIYLIFATTIHQTQQLFRIRSI